MSAVLSMTAFSGTTAVRFGTPERVEWHLENWRRWMHSGRAVEGHATQALGLSNGGASESFDDMAEASDRRCAKAVNAVLDDLPHTQRIAVYMEQGIMGRVFRFARTTYHHELAAAKLAIGKGLAARGVW